MSGGERRAASTPRGPSRRSQVRFDISQCRIAPENVSDFTAELCALVTRRKQLFAHADHYELRSLIEPLRRFCRDVPGNAG